MRTVLKFFEVKHKSKDRLQMGFRIHADLNWGSIIRTPNVHDISIFLYCVILWKNVLSEDLSPYLRQHKNNPVHWQTWSKDSLNQAKTQKKPILLSVGYSSCHWCHVMAHESFEDKKTADLMNEFFINIKVDREERPDLDFVFQSSFQLFNQSGGGWPLTMFLDENGVLFMGGTYFPKVSQNGLPSFKEVLCKVHEAYQEQKTNIIIGRQI